MKIIGIGIDIAEIARIESAIERQGEAFLSRLFTDAERQYCHRMQRPGPCYTARFAAKEAVAKAFGSGIASGVNWLDIEVRRKASGEPFIVLHGGAAEMAHRLTIHEVLLSISHSEHYAVANAIALSSP